MSHEPDMPLDPAVGLLGSAPELNEVYLANVRAGFSERQAMYLLGCILTGSPGPAPDAGPPDPEA
jgi:hypothetical protein